ncbi:MAG: BrnA antitoxin family protein [Acetobacteraceae bacterium]
MRQRGESRTDWTKVKATTEAQVEASAAADPDEPHEADWTQAVVGIPARKQDIHIRIDADVLSWFKATGKGYQTRINNVLRAFVESRRHTAP